LIDDDAPRVPKVRGSADGNAVPFVLGDAYGSVMVMVRKAGGKDQVLQDGSTYLLVDNGCFPSLYKLGREHTKERHR
jgi:hypothetical protein